jgi:hypothetical protein
MDAYPGVPKRSRSGSKSGSKYGPETYFIAENAGASPIRPPQSLQESFFFSPSVDLIYLRRRGNLQGLRYDMVRTAADPI